MIHHICIFPHVKMDPCNFFKCLADETRLKSLLLICEAKQACVCELMEALKLDQPKISRHLAQLRAAEIVVCERRGKWMYYRLNVEMPDWALRTIAETAKKNAYYFESSLVKLVAAQSISGRCD